MVLAVVATPIYAVLKIAVPGIILDNLENNLPDGMTISVGSVSSKVNLEILYEDVRITSENFFIKVPILALKPILNFKSPLYLTMNEAVVVTKTVKINAKNVIARLKLDGLKARDVSIEGQFEEIASVQEAMISQGNFIIAAINNPLKELELKAQKIELAVKVPSGLMNFQLTESQHTINVSETLAVKTVADEARLLLSRNDDLENSEEYLGKDLILNFSLMPETDQISWSLPLNLNLQSITANQTYLFDNAGLSAKAKWRAPSNALCNLMQILSKEPQCGRLTDVINVDLNLNRELDKIRIKGNGYCVAPLSGCRQIIKSRVESLNTESVFARLLSSDAFNPVVTSILMGVLLSSPIANSEYSHYVDLDVTGSKILVNNKPLF